MTYKIIIANQHQWKKDWLKIESKEVQKIKAKIQALATEKWPNELSIKKLKSYPIADYRLRIGAYRVLLDRDLNKKEVVLYRILHRSKLY